MVSSNTVEGTSNFDICATILKCYTFFFFQYIKEFYKLPKFVFCSETACKIKTKDKEQILEPLQVNSS